MSTSRIDRAICIVIVIAASMFLVPNPVGAASGDTGYTLAGYGVTPDACYYARAQAIVPAANGRNVDIKAFLRKKDLNNGCSLSWATEILDTDEGSVRAILYRTSDYTICTSTSETVIPQGYSTFGIGKTYNKSGACANQTYFTVEAQGFYFSEGNRYYLAIQPNFTM